MSVAPWLFVAVLLGCALGVVLVRAFAWAFPSIWAMFAPGGRDTYREMYDKILEVNPSHSRFRAAFYVFEQMRVYPYGKVIVKSVPGVPHLVPGRIEIAEDH